MSKDHDFTKAHASKYAAELPVIELDPFFSVATWNFPIVNMPRKNKLMGIKIGSHTGIIIGRPEV